MNKIVIAITSSDNKNNAATQEDKDRAYKSAIEQFTNNKQDIDVDTLRKILKAISSLLQIKEGGNSKIDSDFYEQTEPRKEADHLFE